MKQDMRRPTRKVMRQVAALACVAVLGLGAAACGSKGNPGTNNKPAATTPPSGPTTAPPTTSPQSGGAGF